MKQITRSYLLLEIEHSKPLPALTDVAAGRVYTLDGVEGATATLLTDTTAFQIAQAQKESEPSSFSQRGA